MVSTFVENAFISWLPDLCNLIKEVKTTINSLFYGSLLLYLVGFEACPSNISFKMCKMCAICSFIKLMNEHMCKKKSYRLGYMYV